MEPCNNISIDVAELYGTIQKRCYEFLKYIVDRTLKRFGEYIEQGGAGRIQWRKNAAAAMKEISCEIAQDMVSVKFGLDPSIEAEAQSNYYAMQIMVALFGNNPPLYTKPGEMTWHSYNPPDARLTHKEVSRAKGVWELKGKHGQADPGAAHKLENALTEQTTEIKKGLDSLIDGINFFDYVIVSTGG